MFGFSFLKGIGIGASAMYFFDPVVGARRRGLVRNQFVSLGHSAQHFVDRGMRDLTNRATGLFAEASAMCCPGEASDEQIVQRVRSTMGRYVSHPRAIDVQVDSGRIVLSGAILEHEVTPLMAAIRKVRGVADVANHLEVHGQPDIQSLQGEGRQARRQQVSPSYSTMSPGAQLLIAAAGAAVVSGALLRQRPVTVLAGLLGCGLMMNTMKVSHGGSTRSRTVESQRQRSSWETDAAISTAPEI